jgi:hypothetical protein
VLSACPLIQDSTSSTAETVSFEGKLKAAGHVNRDEAVMVHSFEVELPVMLGKDSATGITRDDRSPPNLSTHKEWIQEAGSRRVKSNLTGNRASAIASGPTSKTVSGEEREVVW